MAELIQMQYTDIPRLFAVGKPRVYSMEKHMKNNQLGAQWGMAFADGFLARLEAQADFVHDPSPIGFMYGWADGNFTYLIGMLMTEGFALPEGCVAVPIQPATVAIGWIRGRDTVDVCMAAHEQTERALRSDGYACDPLPWCMELYNCPRFTEPNADGLITLDYYIPCERT